MGSVVAFIEALMDAGFTLEQAKSAARVHEQHMAAPKSSAAERQRRYRERKKTETITRDVTSVTSVTRDENRNERDAPRVRVRDITSTSENNHNYTLPEARDPVCDWPEGKPSRYAELICAEMASPWLDLHKSPGLVTTAGLIASWKRDGASWDHDILPLIRGRLMNRRSAVTSWKFFSDAIGETIAANRAALRIPEAGTVIPIRPGTGPPSFAEKIADERQQATTLALKMLENGSNR